MEDAVVSLVRHFQTQFDRLSPDTVRAAKKSILDTFAALLAGTSAEGCTIIARQALDWGGKKESTLFNLGVKVPAFLAALVNGTMARAVDFDDVFEPGTVHASASIVPTALAVAEMKGDVNGKEFLAAVALGIDVICRMAAANAVPPGVSGMNATFQCAYFGCAGVAARLMGLDETTARHAMGLAYSQTAGNSQNLLEGTLATRFCQGLAAQGGIYAAVFAQGGISAAQEVLEGKFGYYPVYQRGAYDRETLLQRLGRQFMGEWVTLKRFPCCMHSHAAIEGVLSLVEAHRLQPEDVRTIHVKVNQQGLNFVGAPLEKKRAPQTVPEAQFSLPYAVATALVKKNVFLDDFSSEEIKNPQVLKLAARVDCTVDPGLEEEAKGSVSPAILEVLARDGTKVHACVRDRRGSPANPMSYDEIADKVMRCAEFARNRLKNGQLQELIEAVGELERIPNVAGLMRVCQP
jgi:2-methylcitrate dehydratase PrpD